jgi:hypothetical protein
MLNGLKVVDALIGRGKRDCHGAIDTIINQKTKKSHGSGTKSIHFITQLVGQFMTDQEHSI